MAIWKSAVGIGVGGALGLILFRSGKGWRSASIATGFGVAMGSSFARLNANAGNKIMAERWRTF